MMKLTARDLHLWRGEGHILKGVRLDVPEGRITVIVGPSGCGKSTLLTTFNRLCDCDRQVRLRGSVLLDGEDILGPRVDLPALRRKVGMVFQTPAPFPMSIAQNVAYGIRLHRSLSGSELEARVRQALAAASLYNEVKDRLDSSALALSGGQQQRLCIARALAVEPQVLLLDEPTSALDPLSTCRIEELLLHLRGKYTLLLVTHNLAQARRLADEAAVMLDGVVIESGPAARVLTVPKDRRAKAYLAGE